MRDFLRGFKADIGSLGTVFLYGISQVIVSMKAVVRYSIKNPAQILAPLGVLICSVLLILTPEDSKLDPILTIIQAILIFIQFGGLIRTIKATKIRRLKDDKERLQDFFESFSSRGIYGIPGSIRFLSIYKDSWLRAWYYRLRGITRLSLYRYGDGDETGSHTKFLVDTKELFHLQLKGCIDTEDPNKAVEGINFVAEDYLTK